MQRVFLKLPPSVGPSWANEAEAAGTLRAGHRESGASAREQAETHTGLEGILQVQRLVLYLPAQLFDLVISSYSLLASLLGSLCQRIALHVLGHPPACPHHLTALLGGELL